MQSHPNILADAPRGRFTFVVGKGGTGKSTTAAAFALHWADHGRDIHLLSTDPAPSIADIFGVTFDSATDAMLQSPCADHLVLEELRAQAVTDAWIARVREPLEQLVEQGTYLDATDVARVAHLTLPGIDELGAALRLAEMATSRVHVVVDTAPTGHTLRLLDAATLIDSWADVFRAMSDKVATIALTMVNARVRLPGEKVIDEMRSLASSFRNVIENAQFIVVTRADSVVMAETTRLIEALRMRRMQVAAVVCVGDSVLLDEGAPVIHVPYVADTAGCAGLRRWFGAAVASSVAHIAHVAPVAPVAPVPASRAHPVIDAKTTLRSVSDATVRGPVRAWLSTQQQQLLWFAGKGGVGKSTCGAAVACEIARSRHVLLCSTDPAGSLGEVLEIGAGVPHDQPPRHLRVLQVDAAAGMEAWRGHYRAEAERVFQHLGVGGSATLDRNVMTAIWDAVPPGIDELFALAEILDASESDEMIVVDAAPTGHFLRLLAAPTMALDWTHAILRILLKYGVASTIDGFSERMLGFAKQLKGLQALMTDPVRCGVFVVTLQEPVVQAQTDRLIAELRQAEIAVAARIENRSRGDVVRSPLATTIRAPYLQSPPVGLSGLDNFLAQWTLA